MERVPIIILLVMLLVPFTASAAPESGAPPLEATGDVPVEPPLVREGDFAVRLAEALGLATAPTETEAESKLSSRGISPASGWIADYPMTPTVIGELRDALTNGAESGRLAMSREEAIQRFDNIASEYQLTIVPSTEEAYAGYSEGLEDNAYDAPTLEDERFAGQAEVVDEYYHEHGPPVVTYYPPPPYYGYLYDWVPYPFFFTGALFTGFFLLHDFHRPVNVFVFRDGRSFPFRRFISNRRFDPLTRRFARIDAGDRFGNIAAIRARGGIRERALLGRNGGLAGRNGRIAANEALGRNRLLDPGARQSAQTILRQDAQRRAALGRSGQIGGNNVADARALARENRQALQNRNSRLLQNDRTMRTQGGRAVNRIGQSRLNGRDSEGAGQAAVRAARQGNGGSGRGSAVGARDRSIQGGTQRLNSAGGQRFSSPRQNRSVNNPRLNSARTARRSFQSPQSRSGGAAFRGASPMNRGTAGSFRPGGRSFAPGGTAFRSGGGFRPGGSSFRAGGGFRSGGSSFRSGGGARFGGGGFRGSGGGGRSGGGRRR